ncbi:MAG: hypothetical protein L3J05_04935, partial [Robiginitomaculum sp.]|nr:hypothetical protein [Robiginitomaculum sp.]
MEHITQLNTGHLNTGHFHWDQGRWPNFSATEMACRHCGQTYVWPEFMDRLQQARKTVGRPFRIHSAH